MNGDKGEGLLNKLMGEVLKRRALLVKWADQMRSTINEFCICRHRQFDKNNIRYEIYEKAKNRLNRSLDALTLLKRMN